MKVSEEGHPTFSLGQLPSIAHKDIGLPPPFYAQNPQGTTDYLELTTRTGD